MIDSSQSPRKLVNRLASTYVSPEYIDHEVTLQPLFSLNDSDPEYRRQRIDRLASQLDEICPCSISFDEIQAQTQSTVELTTLRYSETALAYAGVLVDAALRYPDVKCGWATRALNQAVEGKPESTSLQTAGEQILQISKAIARGESYLAEVDIDLFAHPDDTYSQCESIITQCVRTGDPDRVETTIKEFERARTREWDCSDLLAFEPLEFEQLLVDCWQAHHNAATATRGSKDKGVDVIVETKHGETLSVQAKRYKVGNTVGIAAVQRTAGLLEEFTADRAVLVTSSSFTDSATESAARMDRVELINGDQLSDWLNQSPLSPPLQL